MNLKNPYDLSGKAVVITGGAGVLCSTLARALRQNGARVAVLDINLQGAQAIADELGRAGGEALAVQASVIERNSVEEAALQVLGAFGRVDVLINGAGGNKPQATTGEALSFFDLPTEALRWVFELNCIGTFIPCQVFGRLMADQGFGCIVNISSMAAIRPLTRTVAYSAAKAAISNFTQWLAVHLSQNYSSAIRVNAIAPGFFLTEQNRYLLVQQDDGSFTKRGQAIIDHTPMARLGDPQELVGTVLWLLSDGASFVHGAVIPVDGGFAAFSGV